MRRLVIVTLLAVLVLAGFSTSAAQDDTVSVQPEQNWVQLNLGIGCPDWYRYDMEYYAGTGLAYIMGGRSGSATWDGTIYSYNPVTNGCTNTQLVMPVPIANYTIVTVNNGSTDLLCTFGGACASPPCYTTAVQCYDPIANTVATVSTLPGQLGLYIPGGAAAVNNTAYVFSGFRNNAAPYHITESWAWNPAANTWAQVGDVGLGRGYIDVAVVDGKIYGFGGDVFDGASLVAQTYAEVFDPATGQWDDAGVADLPQASGEGRAYGFDAASGYEFAGKIVIAGGGQWPAEWAEVEIYDVAAMTYDYNFANLNVQRRDHAGFFVPGNPGRMFVFGGRSSAVGYGGDSPPYAPPEYYDVQPGAQPPAMHIGNIWASFHQDPYGRTVLRMFVNVHDSTHTGLAGVAVDGSIWWPTGGPVQRTRVTKFVSGIARFHWGSNQAGAWQLCVDNLTMAGYIYVPGENDVPPCANWSN